MHTLPIPILADIGNGKDFVIITQILRNRNAPPFATGGGNSLIFNKLQNLYTYKPNFILKKKTQSQKYVIFFKHTTHYIIFLNNVFFINTLTKIDFLKYFVLKKLL